MGSRRTRNACNFRRAMDFVLTNTVELLIAAVIVAMLARRIHLPYTVGLVLTGVAIALFRATGETYLTHDLVFRVSCRRCCSRRRSTSIGKNCAAMPCPSSFWR